MQDWQGLFFSPNGRIGQSDYWKGVGVIILANLLLNLIPILGTLIWLVLIYVGVCVYGKRLHDAGRSAIFHAIPWVFWIFTLVASAMLMGGTLMTAILSDGDISPVAVMSAGGAFLFLNGLSTLVWLVYTLWVGLAQGDPGENAYGPAPVIEGQAKPVDPA
ncbi:DUF805 domain-containing protein [Maricaulis sp.]|uniref:DUF805 domain-containing protein n=1 Tax=Maricaulis sp. TaxID=1486257 RepID=UPI002607715F|nr:DUF805 domain-containing protein [Maricaulis sp.]